MKETNMEHYRGEIEAIMKDFEGFGVDIDNSKLIACGSGSCERCKFSYLNNKNKEDPCAKHKIKWLMAEYKPEPVLTAKEKHFVECIEDGWLTKSKGNIITWWEKKPSRDGKHGWIVTDTSGFVYLQEIHPCAFGDMFPFITWEDEEPWAVEDLRKLKVKAGEQDA